MENFQIQFSELRAFYLKTNSLYKIKTAFHECKKLPQNSKHSTFRYHSDHKKYDVFKKKKCALSMSGLDKIGPCIVSQRVVKLYPQQVCQDNIFFSNQKCGG